MQHDVRDRTYRHHNVPGSELRHDLRILRELDAVIDTLDVEVVEGRGHVADVGFFAGVCGSQDAIGFGVLECVFEEVGRVIEFGAGEAEAFDLAGLQRGEEGVEIQLVAVRGGNVSEEADQELGGQIEICSGAGLGGTEAAKDGIIRNAPGDMGLRIEEDFGMLDGVTVGMLKVGVCEGFEVVSGNEGGHADEVVCKKIVERGEAAVALQECLWRSPCRILVSGREGDFVLGC